MRERCPSSLATPQGWLQLDGRLNRYAVRVEERLAMTIKPTCAAGVAL